MLAEVPASLLHVRLDIARAGARVAEGRFEEVLDGVDRFEKKARDVGAWSIALDRTYWAEHELQASLGALAAGRLGPTGVARARRQAEWLTDHGVFDYPSLGHRALAYLHRAEKRASASAASLRRALALSSRNANPHRRWLCLEAARDLGALTLEGEEEAALLQVKGAFALPERQRVGAAPGERSARA